MASYRDEVIVLRTHKLGEADRIVTLLSRHHGKIRAVAKGVRRTSSKFGARLEPFMVADVQLYRGRSLDIVQQAETISSYATTIVADYERYSAAAALCETADRLGDSEATSEQYFLLMGALRALTRAEYPPRSVVDSYLLRTMTLAGWAPRIDSCAKCGDSKNLHAFVPALGGVVCRLCTPAGSRLIDEETRMLLEQLLRGDWADIVQNSDHSQAEASALIANYVSWHLDRGLKSLEHLAHQSQTDKGIF